MTRVEPFLKRRHGSARVSARLVKKRRTPLGALYIGSPLGNSPPLPPTTPAPLLLPAAATASVAATAPLPASPSTALAVSGDSAEARQACFCRCVRCCLDADASRGAAAGASANQISA